MTRAKKRKIRRQGREEKGRMFLLPDTGYSGSGMPQPTPTNYNTYIKQYADAAWVYACVDRIATKFAGVPIKLYRTTKKNGVSSEEEVFDHPIINLLKKPNPFTSGYDMREGTTSFQELTGNAYWLLDSFVDGKPTEIFPLNPKRVRIEPSAPNFIGGYIYDRGMGKTIKIPPEFIIHFKYFNPMDDYYGLAPLSAARFAVETHSFGDKYNLNFFKNSAEPRGALTTDQNLTTDQVDRIKTAWKAYHHGTDKAHRVAILHGNVKWTNIGLTQKDMDFINSKKMTREDTLGVYNVPPAMVGIFDHSNYANTKEQRGIFWMDNIFPKIKKYLNTVNESLVAPFEDNLILKPDYSDIEELQEDRKARAESDKIDIASGVKTINQVKIERRLPPVPWGNVWYAPLNLIPVTSPRPEEEERSVPASGINFTIGPIKTVEEEAAKAKELRTKIWNVFKARSENWEKKLKPILRTFFTGQEKEVIRNLRASGWKILSEPKNKDWLFKQNIEDILFNESLSNKALAKLKKPVIVGALSAQATEEIARLNLGIVFDVTNPRVANWIDSKTFQFAKDVNKATEDRLRDVLKESIANGEGVKQAEKRIGQVFDVARGARTERIARTEIIGALNNGSMEAYKQSGIVKKKEWIDSRDNLVRDTHQIDGEQTGLDDNFSNGLAFPGDPSGSAEEIINCRCTLTAVVSRR